MLNIYCHVDSIWFSSIFFLKTNPRSILWGVQCSNKVNRELLTQTSGNLQAIIYLIQRFHVFRESQLQVVLSWKFERIRCIFHQMQLWSRQTFASLQRQSFRPTETVFFEVTARCIKLKVNRLKWVMEGANFLSNGLRATESSLSARSHRISCQPHSLCFCEEIDPHFSVSYNPKAAPITSATGIEPDPSCARCGDVTNSATQTLSNADCHSDVALEASVNIDSEPKGDVIYGTVWRQYSLSMIWMNYVQRVAESESRVKS